MHRRLFAGPATFVLLAALAAACADATPTVQTTGEALFSQGKGQQSLGSAAGSLGKITLDAEVGWVASDADDGKFITAEYQGIVIGLRAMERFVGLLDVTGARGDRVAVYEAPTGDTEGNNATWNYDWHVDVSDARGRAAGTTLADYTLVLEQDFTEESLFGILGHDPVLLPMVDEEGDPPGVCHDSSTNVRCQQSWNPGFGNDDFDLHAEGTYNLRLVLTPETFRGPPLAVVIRVNVSDG